MADEKYILNHGGAQIDAAIDQAETNRLAIAGKADKNHTHSDKVDKVEGMGLVDENFASRIHVATAESGAPYTGMRFDGEIVDQYDNMLSGKQDIISNLDEIQNHLVDADIHADEDEKEEWNAAYAHSTDTSAHVSSTDRSNWNGKQDKLVSGTNIKTINNQSLLGSGNITISGTSGEGNEQLYQFMKSVYDAHIHHGYSDSKIPSYYGTVSSDGKIIVSTDPDRGAGSLFALQLGARESIMISGIPQYVTCAIATYQGSITDGGQYPVVASVYNKSTESAYLAVTATQAQNILVILSNVDYIHYIKWKEWDSCDAGDFGTLDYSYLYNKPSINGHTLLGCDVSLEDLDIANATKTACDIEVLQAVMSDKVDKCDDAYIQLQENVAWLMTQVQRIHVYDEAWKEVYMGYIVQSYHIRGLKSDDVIVVEDITFGDVNYSVTELVNMNYLKEEDSNTYEVSVNVLMKKILDSYGNVLYDCGC